MYMLFMELHSIVYKMMYGNYQEFPAYSWGVNGIGKGHGFSGPTAVARQRQRVVDSRRILVGGGKSGLRGGLFL